MIVRKSLPAVNCVYFYCLSFSVVFACEAESLSGDHPPSKKRSPIGQLSDMYGLLTSSTLQTGRPESPDRKTHNAFWQLTLEDRKRRQTRDKLFVPNLSIPSEQRSLEIIPFN